MRRPGTGVVAAAAALLVVVPLAGPPALAGAATRPQAATSRLTQPQRTPPGASAAARAGGARGRAGGPALKGTAVKGAVVKGSVARSPMGGATVAGERVANTVGGPELAGRASSSITRRTGARRLPSVQASSYVIADAGTGQVLAAEDPHGHFLPASTLKVLTADALMPVLEPDATVVTSGLAADVTPNAEAHHLQADDTVAVRPNGLNAKGQHSSAYDLALFARQALTMREFMRIEATPAAMFPLPRRHSIELLNQNTMPSTYPGDLGGKIGWTTASETTFIAWARRDGHTLIVTIMHCVALAAGGAVILLRRRAGGGSRPGP